MIEYQVLGPLRVVRESACVPVGGKRQRTVLAMLLLEAGSVVSVERLIDALWDDDPPATARDQVQFCVASVRRILIAQAATSRIETSPPGYVLHLNEDAFDLAEFTRATTAAYAESRVEMFREALGRWRGPALSNVGSKLVQRAALQFDERRVAVLEDCIEAQLRSGVSQELISELADAAQAHPLRERLRHLLVLALYQAGRRAEALKAYRDTYRILGDELGIEPGAELQALHQQILGGTEHAVATAEPGGPLSAPEAGPPPRLLPAAIADFVGREDQIRQLLAEYGEPADPGRAAVPIAVLYGRGGAGKTTLAIRAAQLLAPHFPDGQLFARLREGNRTVSPAEILERFLCVLGADVTTLPDSLELRAELYRNLLGDRRILIVLDDVMSEQQVAPLLPGGRHCAVILTSRRRLTGLSVTSRYEIGEFTGRGGAEMVARIAGAERVTAEPEAVRELCRLTGALPLALRVVAARLAARPHMSIGSLVRRLRDESRQLDELLHAGVGVRASISLSYDSLSSDARRLLRLLAVSESPSFPAWAGAALLNTTVQHAEDLIEELAEAYLLDVETSGTGSPPRYRFHEIIRPYAKERLLAETTATERRAARERLIGGSPDGDQKAAAVAFDRALTEMMFMSTSRRGLTYPLTDFGSSTPRAGIVSPSPRARPVMAR